MNRDRNWMNYNGGKYDLPTLVDGESVDKALEFQCKTLYRGWRYRLKEYYFVGYTQEEAEENRPQEIDEEVWKWLVHEYWPHPRIEKISRQNRQNQRRQTVKPANGALSTARIFHNMINSPSTVELHEPTQGHDQEQVSMYLQLFERLKRHKDGTWDADAFTEYIELQKLHATEIEKHGCDNLTVREAFAKILGEKSGYIRGLGPSVRPSKRREREESNELRAQFTAELESFQRNQQVKEVALSNQIEELKSSNVELKSSNEALKSANDELRADLERMKAEQIERENRLREEFMHMINSRK